MAHSLNRLTARTAQTTKEPGRSFDGGGLALIVDEQGRRWQFRFHLKARRREMGLGSAATVSLKDARDAASAAR